jgi:hypothetical protein
MTAALGNITHEQLVAAAGQVRSLKGGSQGNVLDIRAHDRALEGIAQALEARSAQGLRTHAAALDGAAAHCGEAAGTGHRRIAARAVEISRTLDAEVSAS